MSDPGFPFFYIELQALLKTDIRTANVIALTEVVECLTLDRE